jgi:hypothetical protein
MNKISDWNSGANYHKPNLRIYGSIGALTQMVPMSTGAYDNPTGKDFNTTGGTVDLLGPPETTE